MVPDVAVAQAARIAPWVPRHVLVDYLARLAGRYGLRRVCAPCGCLTAEAQDSVRNDSR
jgi:hypothetical protein